MCNNQLRFKRHYGYVYTLATPRENTSAKGAAFETAFEINFKRE